MATHSTFLPGESHRQRSLESYSPWDHRVRHDFATNTFMFLSLPPDCPMAPNKHRIYSLLLFLGFSFFFWLHFMA